ncbi:DUF2971 domain-containing protein [Psychrobacter sp. TAE2020]|uniref:DUF2971 domain-containing protein n=1 Tax=Psychrobacter sp. TAE2020 TaxID=2846762 RepID=UPI001C111D26|nr:DUF2971 domain-containing protein [Psychrobacter sp. TAE2020]MBU5616742.1 DUF2971 domain-containing protein [Psychrobacter sp. TAE2020]
MNIDDLKDLDDETRKEIEELQKVTREKDGGEAFTDARLKIFNLSYYSKQRPLGYKALVDIEKRDNKVSYYLAQINLGLSEKDDINKSFDRLVELYRDKEFEPISIMISERGLLSAEDIIFKFGKDSILKENYKNAFKFFEALGVSYSYENYCLIKISMMLLKEETREIAQYFLSSLTEVLKIQSSLIVECNHENQYERKLAHYTSTTVANILLSDSKKEENLFRLNTIQNVNDPSEGSLLMNYLTGKKGSNIDGVNLDLDYHAFLSCFTFNHDSLNQFRLYGKENNKEASGVSLVFNKHFFLNNTIQKKYNKAVNDPIEIISQKEVDDIRNVDVSSNTIDISIRKQNVFRCMYLDVSNGYVHLAQRNEVTFYNEFENKEEAQNHWRKYTEYVNSKRDIVLKSLEKLKDNYDSFKVEYLKLKDNYTGFVNELYILENEILLPLKYLVKHSAFQEEQECRIVYITALKDTKVQMEFGRFLYVEYQAEVKENLNKVYIAPAANEYQIYLSWLLRNTEVKIELSNNPYRQT